MIAGIGICRRVCFPANVSLEPAVVLNALRAQDSDGLIETYTNPTLRRFLGGGLSVENAVLRVKNLFASSPSTFLAIREYADSEFLGFISLDAHHDGADTEVSYVLRPHAQGRGITTAALRAALDHAFTTLQLKRVVAETQIANEKSIALLTRLSMRAIKDLVRFDAPQRIFAIDAEAFFELERKRIADAIIERCSARTSGATICPSEVARALWPHDWRARMQTVRSVGLHLAKEGCIEITQRGIVCDASGEIRGAIRYRSKCANERA